jgi:hypothetical protein
MKVLGTSQSGDHSGSLVFRGAPSWTFQGRLIMCSYVRIHVIITFLLIGLRRCH